MSRLISAYCPFLIHFWILTSILLPQFGWKNKLFVPYDAFYESCIYPSMKNPKHPALHGVITNSFTMRPNIQSSTSRKCSTQCFLHAVRSFSFCVQMGTWATLRVWLGTIVNQNQAALNTCSVMLCGIKFFYYYTLQRDCGILDLVRPEREKKLPVVFSVSEVRQLLGCLRSPHYSLFVFLVACIWWGLLLQSFWINARFVGFPGAVLRLFSKSQAWLLGFVQPRIMWRLLFGSPDTLFGLAQHQSINH